MGRLIGVLGVSLALVTVWRWNVQLVKLARAVLLIMLPLAPVMLFQASWAMAAVHCGEEAQLARELPASGSSPRVVWVVFDELEQRALFEKRPKGINLPAFDRLRRESVTASHAEAPGHETERSIPSYLTGRIVTRALVTGPNRLLMESRAPRRWNRSGRSLISSRRHAPWASIPRSRAGSCRNARSSPWI